MVIELHFKNIAKFLFDNADVLQTLYKPRKICFKHIIKTKICIS